MRQLYGAIASSQDPTEVANKVKGIILAGSSVTIFLAATFFHIALTPDNILSVATDVGTVSGAIWAVYGVYLHVVTWIGTKNRLDNAIVAGMQKMYPPEQ